MGTAHVSGRDVRARGGGGGGGGGWVGGVRESVVPSEVELPAALQRDLEELGQKVQ
ncbi:MAG: hypothetical protein VYC94_07200 [Cyanobacteriota bacterium]|nr:hypothetical protein [Cyanobacteriota bacterium]